MGMSGQRIRVVREGDIEPVTSDSPAISSSQTGVTGFILEEHRLPVGDFEGAFAGHLVTVNTGEPYRKEWRTEGRSGRMWMPTGGAALCSGQHVWCSWDRPISFIGLCIQPEIMQHAIYEEINRKVELRPEPGIADQVVDSIVRALDWEVRAGCPGGPLLAESLATDLAVFLARQYALNRIRVRSFKSGLPKTRLRRVIEYIEASLAGDLRIAELADIAGMSPYYFGKLFKQSTGMTVHGYVTHLRIQVAMDLLGRGRAPIRHIAAAVGMPNQSQFTRFFRHESGTTPKRFRQLISGTRSR
jgi:AraC family transcriptional regulator